MGQKPNFRLFFIVFACISFNVSSFANGFWYNDRNFHSWYFGGGYASYGGYAPYGGYAGGTIDGSYLMGMGAYVDAMGRLHVNNAIAARHFQEAYRTYIENYKLSVKTHYEIKDLQSDYRAKHRRPPLTKARRDAIAAAQLPPRLTPKQRNAATGELAWPMALREAQYTDARRTLEVLFKERADRPDLAGKDSDNYIRIADAVDKLNDALRSNIKGMKAAAWFPAHEFLRTLKYEAQFEK
jgi:hypothetical protein